MHILPLSMHSAAEDFEELVASRFLKLAIAVTDAYCLLSAVRVGELHRLLLRHPTVHRHRWRACPLGTVHGRDRVDTSL